MKLKISGFRCFESRELSLPDKGLVLLKGPSGQGKSTVLNAIYFCLYGTLKSPYTCGKTSCSVELSLPELKLIRTKKPNSLKLVKDGQSYSDQVAQSLVDREFGPADKFILSSYFTQKARNSLLHQSPAEQLRVIESLSYEDENIHPDTINESIKLRYNLKDKELTRLSAELELLRSQQDALGKTCLGLLKNIGESGKLSLEKLKALSAELKIWTQKLSSVTEEIKTVEKDKILAEKLYNRADNYAKIKESLLPTRSGLLEKIKLLDKQISELEKPWALSDKESTELKILGLKSDINKLKKNQEVLDRLENEISLLETRSGQISSEKKKLSFHPVAELTQLKTEIKKSEEENEKVSKQTELKELCDLRGYNFTPDLPRVLEEELGKLRLQIKTLNLKISGLKTACPECGKNLTLFEGKLTLSEEDEKQDDLSEKKKRLLELNKTLELSQQDLKKFLKHQELLGPELSHVDSEEKKKLLDRYMLENSLLKRLDTEADTIQKNLSEFLSKKKAIFKSKESLDSLKKKLKEQESYLSEQETLIKELSGLQNERDKVRDTELSITSQLEKLYCPELDHPEKIELNYHRLEKSLDDLKKSKIELSDKRPKMELRRNLISRYNEYTRFKKLMREKTSELEQVEEDLRCTMILREKSRKAQIMALQNTINLINQFSRLYIDSMFSEQLVAELKTDKLLKTSGKKAQKRVKLSTRICYKGTTSDSIYGLSGGEEDRLALCFMLGLNEMFGSRLLLLDESLSSLDSQMSNDILQTLKTQAGDKLILVVSHQVEDGIFDKVIEL